MSCGVYPKPWTPGLGFIGFRNPINLDDKGSFTGFLFFNSRAQQNSSFKDRPNM